jgi:hypothetical protein
MVRFRYLHPLAAHRKANVGIGKLPRTLLAAFHIRQPADASQAGTKQLGLPISTVNKLINKDLRARYAKVKIEEIMPRGDSISTATSSSQASRA